MAATSGATASSSKAERSAVSTSARTSVGALFSYAVTKQVTGYAGAAWEHEFDGKARATSAGLSIDAPSMEGDTGVLQVGLKFTPSADLPLTVDLGLAGTFGQREGIVGSLQAKLAF
jgi:outer membrane autotransporter protein